MKLLSRCYEKPPSLLFTEYLLSANALICSCCEKEWHRIQTQARIFIDLKKFSCRSMNVETHVERIDSFLLLLSPSCSSPSPPSLVNRALLRMSTVFVRLAYIYSSQHSENSTSIYRLKFISHLTSESLAYNFFSPTYIYFLLSFFFVRVCVCV